MVGKKSAPKASNQTPEEKGASDLAKNFESDYAKKSQISAVIEKELEVFDSLVKSGQIDAAVRHGEGTLKALNSAFGADAVGVEEAERLGGFLGKIQDAMEAWKNDRQGSGFIQPAIKKQSERAPCRRSGQDSLQRSKAAREGGIGGLEKMDTAPLSVDDMSDEQVDAELRKKGLIK